MNQPMRTTATEIASAPSLKRTTSARSRLWMGVMMVCLGGGLTTASGQSIEDQTVQSASLVLNETMSKPLSQVPAAMLKDCHGVAIVPNVIKGSFIVGARRGHGLLFIRDLDGTWHAPVFITLTGGNIGWQIGVQSSDIILVFKTARSIQGILSGKLTLGGDASAAAGPVGRQAAVATDGQLQAELYTYSRSRGLFAGVSIDGTVLQVDSTSTGAYYRIAAPGQPVVVPPAAIQLTQAVATYAGQSETVDPPLSQPQPQSGYAQHTRQDRHEVIQDQLLQVAPELFRLLDPQWTQYLALPLPPTARQTPDVAAIRQTLQRYDRVASDPQLRELASRPEFRSVHVLLEHLQHALTPNNSVIRLPQPPSE